MFVFIGIIIFNFIGLSSFALLMSSALAKAEIVLVFCDLSFYYACIDLAPFAFLFFYCPFCSFVVLGTLRSPVCIGRRVFSAMVASQIH